MKKHIKVSIYQGCLTYSVFSGIFRYYEVEYVCFDVVMCVLVTHDVD